MMLKLMTIDDDDGFGDEVDEEGNSSLGRRNEPDPTAKAAVLLAGDTCSLMDST